MSKRKASLAIRSKLLLWKLFWPWGYYKRAVQEALTEALHPEFGYIWREDGEVARAIKEAQHRGWCRCLDSVVASLKQYPNGGGHTEILAEVSRLISQQKT